MADAISGMPHLAGTQVAAVAHVQDAAEHPARQGATRAAPDHMGRLAGRVKQGYASDSWFEQADNTAGLMSSMGLWWHEGCVVVPDFDGLRRELIYLFHDVPYAGHVGINRTTINLQKHYWWPGLDVEVAAYVRGLRYLPEEQARG